MWGSSEKTVIAVCTGEVACEPHKDSGAGERSLQTGPHRASLVVASLWEGVTRPMEESSEQGEEVPDPVGRVCQRVALAGHTWARMSVSLGERAVGEAEV